MVISHRPANGVLSFFDRAGIRSTEKNSRTAKIFFIAFRNVRPTDAPVSATHLPGRLTEPVGEILSQFLRMNGWMDFTWRHSRECRWPLCLPHRSTLYSTFLWAIIPSIVSLGVRPKPAIGTTPQSNVP